MASAFESIFNTNSDVDPNLNKLFTREVKVHKEPVEEETEESEKAVKRTKLDGKALKKVKKADLESEKRTVFIGNLHVDCKKEVFH